MKSWIKTILTLPLKLIGWYVQVIAGAWPTFASAWVDQADRLSRKAKVDVTHDGLSGKTEMTFFTPNSLCRYRAATFSTKEPETLEWIDTYGGRSGAFYDVGANVGMYSIYYAKTHPESVYAFEPSALNIALLAKNISVNGLSNRIVIVSNPLTSVNEIADFRLSMLKCIHGLR